MEMTTIVEYAVLALVAALAGTLTRRTVARRAAGRTAAASGGAAVDVPCQARWRQGLRRRFFGYGKLGAGPDGAGAVFKAPLRAAVRLPTGGRAVVRESWRPGMRVLEYRAPDGRRIDFQVYDAEADRAVRLLGVPDPVDR
ncbi:hypothetical protein [Streptomyces sp. fd1-xmd]|uniref:hypothetical protein n=1 Tax=Streptomyces sp. fd1-xmd TaxID=1812480 RepID=UPI00099085D6|nr:hypothetical protein [Streptomyces sp. fd1-xmd]AQT71802.1 hypothetical protein B1K54_08995 [Streptomyces sp. fd1-xmd]